MQAIPFLMMSVFLFVLRPYGEAMYDMIVGCLPHAKIKVAADTEDAAETISFPDALAAGKITGLASYDPRVNPEYSEALHALKADGPVSAEAAALTAEETPAEQAADAEAAAAI